MKATLAILAACTCCWVDSVSAGPLSMEPRLALSTDYASNPDLRAQDPQPEDHVAFLLDSPLRYDLDALHFALLPSARYSDARGYSSLASNFLRVNAVAQTASELGTLSVTGGASRDSSLYHGGESVRGIGVQRDTRLAAFDWQRYVSSRMQLQLGINWTKVQYGAGAEFTSLTNYRYLSAAPMLGFSLNERTTLSMSGSAGRYRSADGITASNDRSLQLGVERQLSELWTLNASAGYSRSKNSFEFYLGPFYLGTLRSEQTGTIFDLGVKRRGESLTFTAHAARSLRPSGFAFLSRQELAESQLSYDLSDRWSFAAHGSFQRTADPLRGGGESRRRYFTSELSATWRWTPQWSVSLRASRVGQRYDVRAIDADSSGAALEFSRQFSRLDVN